MKVAFDFLMIINRYIDVRCKWLLVNTDAEEGGWVMSNE